MKKLILTAVLLFSFLGKSFADGHVIKAEKSMLYFAGLYPSYILYLQGGIPEDTKDNWVDKDYWAVLEIDESSKNHGGEAVIFKLKKTSSYSPQPEWCVTQGGDKWDGNSILLKLTLKTQVKSNKITPRCVDNFTGSLSVSANFWFKISWHFIKAFSSRYSQLKDSLKDEALFHI